jgi:hypothetical protein
LWQIRRRLGAAPLDKEEPRIVLIGSWVNTGEHTRSVGGTALQEVLDDRFHCLNRIVGLLFGCLPSSMHDLVSAVDVLREILPGPTTPFDFVPGERLVHF